MTSQLALENFRAATLNTSPFLWQSHSKQTPWKPGISLAAPTSWTAILVIMTQFSELQYSFLPLCYSLKNHWFYFLQKTAVGKVITQIHLNLHNYCWVLHWTSLSHCLPRQGLGCLPPVFTLSTLHQQSSEHQLWNCSISSCCWELCSNMYRHPIGHCLTVRVIPDRQGKGDLEVNVCCQQERLESKFDGLNACSEMLCFSAFIILQT